MDFGLSYASLVVWHRTISVGIYEVFGRFVMPGQDSAYGSEIILGFEEYFLELYPAVACATYGDCLMAQEDDYPDGDFEIRGQLVLVHIFSDGFESGDFSAWQ